MDSDYVEGEIGVRLHLTTSCRNVIGIEQKIKPVPLQDL